MTSRIFTEAPLYEPPVRYKIRTPETWEKAREDYAAGVPAPEVCERYDIGLSALRTRARDEGWRRRDLDDPDPEPVDPEAPPADPRRLAKEAWARAARAVERGRVLEGLRWSKLSAEFRQAVFEMEEMARIDRLIAAGELGALDGEADADAPAEP